jgi:agmatine/peptidylarginine deiminase
MSDFVCLTGALCWRHPEVYWPVKLNLESAGIEVKPILKTSNVWLRDYFPIRAGGRLVRFQYDTRGHKKYPQLDVSNEPWTGVFNEPIFNVPIILDGGNVVQHPSKAIFTDKVIKDNGPKVVDELERIFNAEIIIIPIEPGDTLGHSDGIVKFIDTDNVLVNGYEAVAKRDHAFIAYQEELESALADHNLTVHRFPNAYDAWNWNMTEKQFRQCFPESDSFNPGFGYYLNFLKIDKTILLPAMKIPRDKDAYFATKAHFPDHRIVMIDCSCLSMEGGLLNCISWSDE